MISKTGKHAILALSALARLNAGAYAGAADIAREIGAPRNYLGKLLKILADQGLLESQKGKGGGFRLSRDPAKISLLEIIDPIERVRRWSDCFLGKKQCRDARPCAVHGNWKIVRETYLRFLKTTTLASLSGQTARRNR